MDLLLYLGLTILIELPVFLIFWSREGWGKAILFCILVNGFTNPTLNLLLREYPLDIYLMECAVVAVEAALAVAIFRSSWGRALLFSLLANGLSYGIGVVLFTLKII